MEGRCYDSPGQALSIARGNRAGRALTGFCEALGLATLSNSLCLVDLGGLQVLADLLAVDKEEVLLADVLLEEAAKSHASSRRAVTEVHRANNDISG